MKKPKFKTQRVWATWRGPGFVPCLWGNPRRFAEDNRDPDEYVIRVDIHLVQKKRSPRAQKGH